MGTKVGRRLDGTDGSIGDEGQEDRQAGWGFILFRSPKMAPT